MERCKREGEFLSFHEVSDWLFCYEKDSQPLYAKMPLLVFRPYTAAHIAPFLQACHQMEIPVTIRCGGTGLSGGCVPSKESVVLLTGHLNQIKDYHRKAGTISIGPGVTVRQLNRYVAADGWFFPLSLATEGTAGIAGCLSCNSRGYHQQQRALYDVIEQVTLIDGQGQVIDVPASLVCGAEALWGVIIELKMRLKKLPSQRHYFSYAGSWHEILIQLPKLRSIHALTSLIWSKDRFYFKLEGDDWRLPSAAAFLARCLPEVTSQSISLESICHSFLPSRPNFAVISSSFRTDQLSDACAWSLEQAQSLQLECFQMVDLLAGSLHLILQTAEDLYSFSQKMEQYLVIWADFVDGRQGILGSTHGIGMQMRPYMPPFWTEESQRIWRNLQTIFDPKHLFGKEHFFPALGKSLEKVQVY
jgi:FAD/FMN-containing dehydrogenase